MSARRGRIIRLTIVAVCLVWLAWIVYKLGPRRILAESRSADPAWLALSFAPLLLRFLIWGFKWWRMLRRRGPVGFWWTLTALLSGNFVNLTTPTAKLAGGFLRAALINRRTGWGMSTAYGWSLADQVTNVLGNLMLCGLLATSAGLVVVGGARSQFLGAGAAALVTVVAVVAARDWGWRQVQRPALSRWLARLTPRRFRVEGHGGPTAAWVLPVFEPLMHVGRTIRVAPADLTLAACSFGSLCVANALVLQALGTEASVLRVAVAVVIGYFAGTVLGTLGGIGVTEVALIELYQLAGVTPEAAAAGALLHRASYYAVIVLLGGGSLLWEARRKPDAAR